MKLIEQKRGVAARGFGPFVRYVANAPGRHTDLFADVGKFETGFLKIANPFCPCIHHGGNTTVSRTVVNGIPLRFPVKIEICH